MKDEFELLKQAYAKELPEKIRMIENLVRSASNFASSGEPYSAWNELEIQLHKLAGSSGIYGFPELSALSRHLEVMISNRAFQSATNAQLSQFLKFWFECFSEQVTLAKALESSQKTASALVASLEQMSQWEKAAA